MPAPPETIDDGAAFLATCFNFGELIAGLFSSDPQFADVIEPDCIRSVFDEETSTALFAELLANPTAFDDDEVPESLAVIFECFQFGQLMATQFAGLVDLTEAEITCIDEAFTSDEAIAAMLGGADLPPGVEQSFLACLSPETLQALGGG